MMDNGLRLFCGDCLDVMQGLPDAAVLEGRGFVGIEKAETYFDLAKRWIYEVAE